MDNIFELQYIKLKLSCDWNRFSGQLSEFSEFRHKQSQNMQFHSTTIINSKAYLLWLLEIMQLETIWRMAWREFTTISPQPKTWLSTLNSQKKWNSLLYGALFTPFLLSKLYVNYWNCQYMGHWDQDGKNLQ